MRERRNTGLDENLGLGQICGLCREVGIANTGLGGLFVRKLGLGQVYGVSKLVFAASDDRLSGAEDADSIGESGYSS